MVQIQKNSYHHGDLRESLLNAAEAALAELPVEQVSLREIARRAGVSHAAPRHHFATVGQLYGELVGRAFERFVAALDEAAGRSFDQSPAARLQAMARAYLRFAEGNRATYGLMFGKRAGVERTPRFMTAAFVAWSQLEREVTALVGPQRAAYGSLHVWSSCHGLAMLLLDSATPPNIDPDHAVEAVTRMVLAGLQSDT
ncbi:MAG: TetR/AcrR family transcriptional regulator [Rhizobiales bacterium]|nr:TetR/AcrR family transcriptional regulator [Hyphomicrobiales bacterium]